MILTLAKVLGLKKFGQTDDLGSALGGLGDAAESLVEILFGLRAAGPASVRAMAGSSWRFSQAPF